MAKKIKGAGDVVKTITEAIGIEECNNCQKRKDWLNVNFPFRKPIKPTQEQLERIEIEPMEVYNECFGMNIDKENFTGGVKSSILKKLKKLKEYED